MQRILYLTHETVPIQEESSRGGVIYLSKMLELLPEYGWNVDIIEVRESGVSPHENIHSVKHTRGFLDKLRIFKEGLHLSQKNNFDLILTKNTLVYPFGFFLSKLLDIPHIVHVGALPIPDYKELDLIDEFNRNSFIRLPHDAYLTVGKSGKKNLSELGIDEKKIHMVPNATDIGRFKAVEQEVAKAKLGINRDKKIMLFVGGLEDVKNLNTLIDAYASSEKLKTQTELHLVGDGSQKKDLEEKVTSLGISDNTVFHGSKEFEEMPLYYASADFFVLPSKAEVTPRVIIEAMAAGLPIVATSVGDIPLMIKDSIDKDSNIYLVDDPISIRELKNKLEEATDDDSEPRYNLEGYTWKNVIEKHLETFKVFLKNR